MTGISESPYRRTLRTRDARWAASLARWLGGIGVRPNVVSLAGVVFALGGLVAFSFAPAGHHQQRSLLLLVAAACIQLRLLCNLLDGMLAVEGRLASKTGEIWNDLPDRISDVLLLVGAGYAIRGVAHGVALGWTAAALALFTAYIRVLGASLGVPQLFIGPMAKQHRMFVLSVGAVLAAGESAVGAPPRAIAIALAVIVAGSILTAIRRTRRTAETVNAR